jgi:hypothetical protein
MVMKKLFLKFILLSFAIIAAGCKEDLVKSNQRNATQINQIKYAKGLAIYKYKGFSILSIKNPWPNATEEYTYILKEKTGVIPDSLREFPIINIPLKKIVVTSTTHIPSLEMLDVENTLIGFPHTDYISSEKVRKQIDNNKIKLLPPTIGGWLKLERLLMHNNQLKLLPKQLPELVMMEVLTLSGNRLTNLPWDLWKLKRLQTIFKMD